MQEALFWDEQAETRNHLQVEIWEFSLKQIENSSAQMPDHTFSESSGLAPHI